MLCLLRRALTLRPIGVLYDGAASHSGDSVRPNLTLSRQIHKRYGAGFFVVAQTFLLFHLASIFRLVAQAEGRRSRTLPYTVAVEE